MQIVKLASLAPLVAISSLTQDRAKFAEGSKDTAYPISRTAESLAAFPAVNILDYVPHGRRAAVADCTSLRFCMSAGIFSMAGQRQVEQRVDAAASLEPNADGQRAPGQAPELLGQLRPHQRFLELRQRLVVEPQEELADHPRRAAEVSGSEA